MVRIIVILLKKGNTKQHDHASYPIIKCQCSSQKLCPDMVFQPVLDHHVCLSGAKENSCGVLAKKVGHAKVRLEGPVNYLFS